MAYAFVAASDAATLTDGPSISQSITCVAGENVIVLLNSFGSAQASSVSDGTNTYARCGTAYTDTVVSNIWEIWMAKNVAAVTGGTLTATFGAPDFGYAAIAYLRYTGLDTTANVQTTLGSTQNPGSATTDAITSGNMTPTSQPAMVLGFTVDMTGNAGTISAGTGFTSRSTLANWASTLGFLCRAEDKRITSTSAVAATFTASSGASGAFMTFGAVFTEAAAGGGGAVIQNRLHGGLKEFSGGLA
jgi:hypothetical protein